MFILQICLLTSFSIKGVVKYYCQFDITDDVFYDIIRPIIIILFPNEIPRYASVREVAANVLNKNM